VFERRNQSAKHIVSGEASVEKERRRKKTQRRIKQRIGIINMGVAKISSVTATAAYRGINERIRRSETYHGVMKKRNQSKENGEEEEGESLERKDGGHQ